MGTTRPLVANLGMCPWEYTFSMVYIDRRDWVKYFENVRKGILLIVGKIYYWSSIILKLGLIRVSKDRNKWIKVAD